MFEVIYGKDVESLDVGLGLLPQRRVRKLWEMH